MDRYLKYDERWKIFFVDNKEQYYEKFVVKGCFHNLVNQDVIKDYSVIEHLMVYAYYHWPLYDEALNKIGRTFEMAVKLKAKDLGISLKKSNNYDKRFVDIINEVLNNPYSVRLKDHLNRVRNIRNMQLHPDSYSYMGGFPYENYYFFVNTLNELFQDEELRKIDFELEKKSRNELQFFEGKLLILEFDRPSVLIERIIEIKVLDGYLFILMNPLLTDTYNYLKKGYEINEVLLILSDFQFTDNTLEGETVDGMKVKLCVTDKKENNCKLNEYKNDIERLSFEEKSNYISLINQRFFVKEFPNSNLKTYHLSMPIVKAEYFFNAKRYKQTHEIILNKT